MGCIFCASQENLTDEHVFPAFMGGELEVKSGSCNRCNGDFSDAEAALKEATRPLLNLLKIKNRYGIVPNARVNAEVRGLGACLSIPKVAAASTISCGYARRRTQSVIRKLISQTRS